MPSYTQIVLALVASVHATHLTLNDYTVLKNAVNNPPACGIGYQHLDVNKITAIAGIGGNYDSKCGSCVQVCGSSSCGYLLVVDGCAGSDHIDISTVAGPSIVGSDTGNHDVTMKFVDSSNCGGIWDGQGMDVAFPDGGAPANWAKLNSGGGGDGGYQAPATSPSSVAVQNVAPAPSAAPAPSTAPEVPSPYVAPEPEVQQTPSVQQPPSVEQEPVPSSTAEVAPPETPYPAVQQPQPTPSAAAPSSFTTVTTKTVPTPSPAAPAEYYEEPSAPTTASIETPVDSVHIPTPSGGAFYEASPTSVPTPSSVAVGTATYVVPTANTSHFTPSPSPAVPLFTGAASKNTAMPVVAGSLLAGFMALLF
ncbi:hypothetical protein EJ05DRAFT_479268 [Pseudovirgaria hyperparasitica]|uniref:Expansin-like EG45 domain-containing protein n=1 Tax=Pseudovirgaria hyperparasitica TaxID=470096 RepID=A0A6A6VZV2_9PEZI|nr:uncharacterized protein EJ05DRAFT_479268 [Pseudovirgaria hyperparasitica]KAF2754857.1 hypothetical protein EJ05DRAFT_479268 [Pseudovirgaria hyperparasitica]